MTDKSQTFFYFLHRPLACCFTVGKKKELKKLIGFYDSILYRPRLERFCNSVENKPVLSLVGGNSFHYYLKYERVKDTRVIIMP